MIDLLQGAKQYEMLVLKKKEMRRFCFMCHQREENMERKSVNKLLAFGKHFKG